MWTRFMDMRSGGNSKEAWKDIYIEAATEEEAKVIFCNRFGHSPENVSCPCCGEDYGIASEETLEQATAPERWCRWDDKEVGYVEEPEDSFYCKYRTLAEYSKDDKVLFIGDVPE